MQAYINQADMFMFDLTLTSKKNIPFCMLSGNSITTFPAGARVEITSFHHTELMKNRLLTPKLSTVEHLCAVVSEICAWELSFSFLH